jgi:hypothetical protein
VVTTLYVRPNGDIRLLDLLAPGDRDRVQDAAEAFLATLEVSLGGDAGVSARRVASYLAAPGPGNHSVITCHKQRMSWGASGGWDKRKR